MSPRYEIVRWFDECGWLPLHDTEPSKVIYYRWSNGVRREICVIFDGAGRISCWTEWHNRRVTGPDQDAGKRSRLEHLVATA